MAKIPKFKSEEEERLFWLTHDSTDYLEDMEDVNEPIMDERRKKIQTSLRIDPLLKKKAEILAKSKGVRYQTLIQMWIKEKIDQEVKLLQKTV